MSGESAQRGELRCLASTAFTKPFQLTLMTTLGSSLTAACMANGVADVVQRVLPIDHRSQLSGFDEFPPLDNCEAASGRGDRAEERGRPRVRSELRADESHELGLDRTAEVGCRVPRDRDLARGRRGEHRRRRGERTLRRLPADVEDFPGAAVVVARSRSDGGNSASAK